MTTVFITGDRSLPVRLAYPLTQMILAKIFAEEAEAIEADTFKLATGDAPTGIERAIRYIVPEHLLTVVPRGKTPEGYIDWDKGAADACKIADKAVIVHMQPLESRVTQAILAHFDPENVDMPLAGIGAPKADPSADAVALSKDEVSEFDKLVAGLDPEKKSE